MKTSAQILAIALLLPGLPSAAQNHAAGGEVPELAGAERVTGSTLTDGELPLPYLDYVIMIPPKQSQRLSIYRNGLVTMTTTIEDRSTIKKVLFPPGAIETYRKYLDAETLKRAETQSLVSTPTRLRETIRIYDDEQHPVERTYDPSLYLPSSLESARALLQDLARIVIEDNEITNPMSDYEPAAGDKLIDLQMEPWTVRRIVNDHVEVQADRSPLRAWVKVDQLDEQFMSWSRVGRQAE